MVELERELTYLARGIPGDILDAPHKTIVDIYYPLNDQHSLLRLRQNGDRYEMTKKIPVDGSDDKHEHTIPLTAEEFAALAKAPGKRVAKERYFYTYEGRTAEIDIFLEDLAGLVEVDFEFTASEDPTIFVMPDFCLADVTPEVAFAGGMLAGKTYADIAGDLACYNYKPLKMEEK